MVRRLALSHRVEEGDGLVLLLDLQLLQGLAAVALELQSLTTVGPPNQPEVGDTRCDNHHPADAEHAEVGPPLPVGQRRYCLCEQAHRRGPLTIQAPIATPAIAATSRMPHAICRSLYTSCCRQLHFKLHKLPDLESI